MQLYPRSILDPDCKGNRRQDHALTLPRLGSRVRIPSPAPEDPAKLPFLFRAVLGLVSFRYSRATMMTPPIAKAQTRSSLSRR
jgi:hypothetical protein